MKTQMPFNNEIEKTKKEIEVLTKKLSLLEELEKTKSPAEEAYKRVYGNYPVTDIADACWSGSTWTNFAAGYNAAQKDYKVGEYQEPEPKEEPKTLYDILRELDKPMFIDDVCSAVERWIFQYDCKCTGVGKEYFEGYEECQTVLEERLK